MLLPFLFFPASSHAFDAIDGDKEKLVVLLEVLSLPYSLLSIRILVFPAIIVPMFNVAYDMHEETLWTCVSREYVLLTELLSFTQNWTHCPDGVVNIFAFPGPIIVGMPEIAEIASTILSVTVLSPPCRGVELLV